MCWGVEGLYMDGRFVIEMRFGVGVWMGWKSFGWLGTFYIGNVLECVGVGVAKGGMYIGEGLMVGNLKGCGLCVCCSVRAKDGVYMHMRCLGRDRELGLRSIL